MSVSNENNPRIVMVQIGDVSAGAAASLPGMQAIGKDEIKSITLINNADLAGDDTDNVQVVLQEKSGPRVLGTYLNDVASGGLTAREGKKLTLAAEADLKLADLENVEVDVSHNGTGQALTGAVLMVELIA